MALHGADFSEWNNTPPIGAQDFVILRASYGSDGRDSSLTRFAGEARRMGKLLGFYHYAYPDFGNTALDEANNFLRAVEPYLPNCVLALDWEGKAVSSGIPVIWAYEFLEYVENKTGCKPFFYTFENFTKNESLRPLAARFPLWVADWNGGGEPGHGVWDKAVMHQWTSNPHDRDIFFGTADEFKSYYGGDNVTQEQFNKMMEVWIKERAKAPASEWAKGDIAAVEELGLMKGGDGSFQPRKFVERQELAAVISRMTHG